MPSSAEEMVTIPLLIVTAPLQLMALASAYSPVSPPGQPGQPGQPPSEIVIFEPVVVKFIVGVFAALPIVSIPSAVMPLPAVPELCVVTVPPSIVILPLAVIQVAL